MVKSESEIPPGSKKGYRHIVIEFIVALVILSAVGTVLTLDHAALGITDFYELISKLILLGLGVLTLLTLIRVPLKHRMEERREAHFASTVSYFATLIVFIAAFLALLSILSISFSSLLIAVGGISIVVGFAVSTITTNVISGAFMLTSYPIKVGQRIVITVNNQPGTITSVGTLFLTVTTDAGAKLIIPNSALFQGMAFLLDIDSELRDRNGEGQLPQLLAKPGDRVISSLYPYPGTVVAVTSLVTRVVTDTGQVLTIPNQSILNGGSALVCLEQKERLADPTLRNLPIAIGDEVRLGGGTFSGKVTEIGPYYFKVSGSEEDVLIPTMSLTTGGILVFKKKARSPGIENQIKSN